MLSEWMIDIDRALKNGLTFRPIPETAKATLERFKKHTAETQARLRSGISSEQEREVVAAWHVRKK